ncbi:hypothetical protein OAP18_01320 [Gammaproteobacteria bacterium]|nr:hypothetical protein [Gammaproteobacteria bacterium]
MKILIFIMLIFAALTSCSTMSQLENQYQWDADHIRLEHLVYWTGIVEEYYKKTGTYPFQEDLSSSEEIGLVKIATVQQRRYLSPGSIYYDQNIDNNAGGSFLEFPIKDFVTEIETALGREIEERYDIQKVPTSSPVGYYYFVTNEGYLMWTTCITCDVTQISTLLLFGGYVPTVNIVSSGLEGQVSKALLREEMISHSTFQTWLNRPFYKETYVRSLVQENINDSKQ